MDRLTQKLWVTERERAIEREWRTGEKIQRIVSSAVYNILFPPSVSVTNPDTTGWAIEVQEDVLQKTENNLKLN